MHILNKNTTRLLKLFYKHPGQAFYMQEIGRMIGKKPGVFQRAIYNLAKQGILTSEYKANARFFRINKSCPIYKELKSIISKKSILLILVFFFLAILIVSPGGYCAESDTKEFVFSSLEDAAAIALQNNKDIQIQEREVDVALANIMGARSALLPNLGVAAGYTHNAAVLKATAHSKKDQGVFTGYIDNNSVGLAFNQSVYSGGANISNLRQKQLDFVSQRESLRAKKLDVEFEAKRLYYGLLLAYETERIARELVGQAQAHYENVKNRFMQGTSSRFDVLQSKVQVSLLIPELVKAQNSVELIMADLKKLLYLKINTPLKVEDRLHHNPIEIKEEDFLKTAYFNKPEMIIKSLGIDITQWGIKQARSSGLPQVNASANYNYYSNELGNMFNKRHNNWDIGVSATMPIFDGFSTKAKVDAAKAKYQEAILSKENLTEQIAVDVRQACLDLREAQAIIDSQKDNIEEAREAVQISEISYDSGVGINLDVLDSQVSLGQVQKNLVEGVYDYLMTKANLDRTMGVAVLKEESNEKKN